MARSAVASLRLDSTVKSQTLLPACCFEDIKNKLCPPASLASSRDLNKMSNAATSENSFRILLFLSFFAFSSRPEQRRLTLYASFDLCWTLPGVGERLFRHLVMKKCNVNKLKNFKLIFEILKQEKSEIEVDRSLINVLTNQKLFCQKYLDVGTLHGF